MITQKPKSVFLDVQMYILVLLKQFFTH